MKKYFLLIFIFVFSYISLYSAELCKEFDSSLNLITVDCQTGKRIITPEERAQTEKIRQEAAKKARAERIRKAKAEQRRIEKAIEKRKRKLAKQRQKQAQHPRHVQMDGKTYYLYESPRNTGAVGIEEGNWLVSLYGGAGTYLTGKTHINYTTIDADRVILWSAGISGIYFINRYLGFGIGLELDQAPETDRKGHESYSKSYREFGTVESKVSLQKALLLGRLNLNPAHSARLYVPFGLGYAYIKDKQKNQGVILNGYSSYNISCDRTKTDTTLVYFAGLGLEFDLTERVSLGLEGRYNMFKYDDESFTYINGLAKVNIKF